MHNGEVKKNSLGFGVCDSIWKLVDDHSFCPRLTLRLCKGRASTSQPAKRNHSITLYLFCISKITGILIRSKLTVTNKGTYQDTLACMQLYHAFRARLISRPPGPPTKSVGYDSVKSVDRSQLYGRY